MQERTFSTRSSADAAATGFSVGVERLRCRLKKITTTDEGIVSLAVEVQIADNDELEQIRDLIRVQQGEVLLSIAGTQGELPL
jgi:hypothetical protein